MKLDTQRTLELAGVCVFCGHDVPEANFPWLHARHDVHGNPCRNNATGIVTTICPGSRNVFTLDVLGLRELEARHIPPVRGAA